MYTSFAHKHLRLLTLLYIFAFQLRGNEMHRREGLRTHQQVKERMRIQMAVRSFLPF